MCLVIVDRNVVCLELINPGETVVTMKHSYGCPRVNNSTLLLTGICLVVVVTVSILSDTTVLHQMWTLSTILTSASTLDTPSLQTTTSPEHHSGAQCKDYLPKLADNCSLLELLARIDPTARSYDSALLCDESSSNFDLICQSYLKQIGLEAQSSTICCLDKVDRVPKIVYYVVFGVYEFRLVHYISIKAAKRFISPTAIYLVGDQHPRGKWWKQVMSDVHGVRFLYRQIPDKIKGLPSHIKHLSDLVRLQLLYMNGGIYLDTDTVVVRDLEPLLEYNITLGLIDNATGMGNAFIVARRRGDFIAEWYSQYDHYNNSNYYWNSLRVPRLMWLKNPSRVHMVSDKIYRPNWFEAGLLFNKSGYPWRDNYAVHVWSAEHVPVPERIEDITTANTTVAQIFRYVLYGDENIRG